MTNKKTHQKKWSFFCCLILWHFYYVCKIVKEIIFIAFSLCLSLSSFWGARWGRWWGRQRIKENGQKKKVINFWTNICSYFVYIVMEKRRCIKKNGYFLVFINLTFLFIFLLFIFFFLFLLIIFSSPLKHMNLLLYRMQQIIILVK